MKDSNLSEALRTQAIPDGDAAKQRTKTFASQVVVHSQPTSSPHRWQRAVIGAVATVGVAAFFIAPVGQSMAERVGDLIAIGDGDAPTPQIVSSDSVGLGDGTAPNGTAYSLVASQPRGDVCMSLEFPAQEKSTSDCGYPPGEAYYGTPTPRNQSALTSPFFYAAGDFGLEDALGDATGVVQGNAAPEVASVKVTYEDESARRVAVPTRMFSLEGEQQIAIGANEPLKTYVSFPPSASLGSLEVAAYGTDGDLLGTFDGGERMSTPSAPNRAGGRSAPRPSIRPSAD